MLLFLRTMNNICGMFIFFDYGGYYSNDGDDVRWNRREDQIYNLVMKENITYFGLVTRICKKIKVDEATMKLKLSYIPSVMDPKRPSYILDDEDVLGYLMVVNKDQCKSILHVELIEGVLENQNCENFSRDDRGSRVVITNEDHASEARRTDLIISVNAESKSLEQYEMMENDPDIIDGENDSHEKCAYVDDHGTSDNVDVVNLEWEDGIGLTLGQEFKSKQAVKDLVEKGAHRNCFEFTINKSAPDLYVLKCREVDCKWYLRVAKPKNSDCLSVRTYNKMHTCSRVTTSTSRNRRKCTTRLVASVLHEDYPGQFDTAAPKNIIDMVQERLGVKISYSTALRGKKQAASDVQGTFSNEEGHMRN